MTDIGSSRARTGSGVSAGDGVALLADKNADIARTAATAVGLLLRAAALYLMLAAYDTADPKFDTGQALTINALFVAACLAPRNKAALGVALAGGALVAAHIQSKHHDALHQSFFYATVGFSLLTCAFAAEWLWGKGFRTVRPHNRVRLIRSAGVIGAIVALGMVYSDIVSPPILERSPDANELGYEFGRQAFVGDYAVLAVMVSGLALAVFLVTWFWPRFRRATLGPATDGSCRYTELIAACSVFALLGQTLASAMFHGHSGSITLAAAIFGAAFWVFISTVADDTYAERKRVAWNALRIMWWTSFTAWAILYLALGGSFAIVAYFSFMTGFIWAVGGWSIRDYKRRGFWG